MIMLYNINSYHKMVTISNDIIKNIHSFHIEYSNMNSPFFYLFSSIIPLYEIGMIHNDILHLYLFHHTDSSLDELLPLISINNTNFIFIFIITFILISLLFPLILLLFFYNFFFLTIPLIQIDLNFNTHFLIFYFCNYSFFNKTLIHYLSTFIAFLFLFDHV